MSFCRTCIAHINRNTAHPAPNEDTRRQGDSRPQPVGSRGSQPRIQAQMGRQGKRRLLEDIQLKLVDKHLLLVGRLVMFRRDTRKAKKGESQASNLCRMCHCQRLHSRLPNITVTACNHDFMIVCPCKLFKPTITTRSNCCPTNHNESLSGENLMKSTSAYPIPDHFMCSHKLLTITLRISTKYIT